MAEEWIVEVREDYEFHDTLLPERAECYIFRVPAVVRKLNDEAYTPRVASFGPYHHGRPHLEAMECYKGRALLSFLKRSGRTLPDVLSVMRQKVSTLMDAYDELELEPKYRDDEDLFLKLMIRDGCFLLELILYLAGILKELDYARPCILEPLYMDMLMLENQLPLLVIHILLSLERHHHGARNTNQLILNMFTKKGIKGRQISTNPQELERHSTDSGDMQELGLHLLHVCRSAHVRSEDNFASVDCGNIYSARSLHRAGVHIAESKHNGFFGVEFVKGKLIVSSITVDEFTESLLLNIMAFEEVAAPSVGKRMTCYVFLMNGLIEGAEDVALLKERGIIKNVFGSDSYICDLFNNLTKGAVLPNGSGEGQELGEQMGAYVARRRNRWAAFFLRNKVESAVIATFAGLFLTAIQTMYAVFSYGR